MVNLYSWTLARKFTLAASTQLQLASLTFFGIQVLLVFLYQNLYSWLFFGKSVTEIQDQNIWLYWMVFEKQQVIQIQCYQISIIRVEMAHKNTGRERAA